MKFKTAQQLADWRARTRRREDEKIARAREDLARRRAELDGHGAQTPAGHSSHGTTAIGEGKLPGKR